jgi:hypothetical protein
VGRFALRGPCFGQGEVYFRAAFGPNGTGDDLGRRHFFYGGLPGFGSFRLFGIRYLRGGMLALRRMGIGRLFGGLRGGVAGSAGLAVFCLGITLLVRALISFCIALVVFSPGGFRVEGEFGVSS